MTAVVDMYPKVFRRGYRRELLILALSVISYFLGLVMLTEVSGEHRVRDVNSTAQDWGALRLGWAGLVACRSSEMDQLCDLGQG